MYVCILNEDIQQPELAPQMNADGKAHCECAVTRNTAPLLPEASQAWARFRNLRRGQVSSGLKMFPSTQVPPRATFWSEAFPSTS